MIFKVNPKNNVVSLLAVKNRERMVKLIVLPRMTSTVRVIPLLPFDDVGGAVECVHHCEHFVILTPYTASKNKRFCTFYTPMPLNQWHISGLLKWVLKT